jgi:hypothetical protein
MVEPRIPAFWGLAIPANSKRQLLLPDEVYTEITGACVPDIADPAPSIVTARVTTILLDQLNERSGEAPQKTDDVVVAVLRPNVVEHTKLSLVFSPLSTVELSVAGPNEVHVSGVYTEISDGEEVEEDGEEEFEEGELGNETAKRLGRGK